MILIQLVSMTKTISLRDFKNTDEKKYTARKIWLRKSDMLKYIQIHIYF